MEIEIKNFGPIRSLKFDLEKDLHLIYGKNGVGKSYATYLIYCLLKNIKNKVLPNNYYARGRQEKYIEVLVSELKSLKLNQSADFTEKFVKLIERDLAGFIINGFQNSLLNTFSSLSNLKNRLSNENYEITIFLSKYEKLMIFSNDMGDIDLKYKDDIDFQDIKIVRKNTKSTRFSLYINSIKIFGTPNEDEFISEFIYYSINKVNGILKRLDDNIRDIYYLPASRSGLYQALNAFAPIIAELTQSRFFMQSKSIELPSLSEPLADYFIDLSTLNKKNNNKEFSEITDILQFDILKGEVEYNDAKKRIHFKPEGIDLELNLSEVSSMVAELSPLVLYFKHILNYKYASNKNTSIFDLFSIEGLPNEPKEKEYDILFIEEPEAHLHPEVQVQLIELFSKLPALGLKVFITSHSNYMFNKLNNMLIKKEVDAESVAVYHLVNSPKGTVLNDGMAVSDEGINDENFQSVSENLYYERLNYLENSYDSED